MIDLNLARKLVAQEIELNSQFRIIGKELVGLEKELAAIRNRHEVSQKQGGKPLSVSEIAKLEILPNRIAELTEQYANLSRLIEKVEQDLKPFSALPEMKVKTMSEKPNARKAQVVYVVETPEGKRQSITLHLKQVNGKWTGKHPITGKQDTIFNL